MRAGSTRIKQCLNCAKEAIKMTTKQATQQVRSRKDRIFTAPFNELTEPGAYYFHSTGWLVRIPDAALANGHSPVLSIDGDDECPVTKISDNPWIPINKARQICSDYDYMVNF